MSDFIWGIARTIFMGMMFLIFVKVGVTQGMSEVVSTGFSLMIWLPVSVYMILNQGKKDV